MPIRKRNLAPVLVREGYRYPVSTIIETNEIGVNKEEANVLSIQEDTIKTIGETKNNKSNIVLFKQLNKKQSEITTNTLKFGFSCTGTTIGMGLLLAGLGVKGLTVNQSLLLEFLGAGLLSFCAVKCVKCLVRIACPLDGKEALIPDSEEQKTIEGSIQEEPSKKLELRR